MDNKVNLAVVGIGYWGSKLIREYADIGTSRDDFKLAALCDADAQRLNQAKGNTLKGYSDYKDLMKDPSINAVHIAVPNTDHYKVAKEALLAGKHVLLEKPLCYSAEEAKELCEIAKQKNLVFKAGLIFRFANSLNFLKQVIRSNKHFDRIYFSRFTWEFSRKPMPNVSIIWDLMPHLIDMFLYVNDIKDGDVKIDKLQGSFRRQDKSELADIKLRIGDEDAIFRISWFSSHKTRLIEVFGEKDGKDVSIQLDIITQEMKYIVNDEDGVKDTKIEGFYANNTIKDEAENFIHAIQTGTNDKNNAEDSLLGLEIIRKIEGS